MAPETIDTARLLEDAVREKVAFVPGTAFYPLGGGRNTMRLNFSNATEPMIEEGIARLARALEKRLPARTVPV
jgi:2-aminoadipate transaminase